MGLTNSRTRSSNSLTSGDKVSSSVHVNVDRLQALNIIRKMTLKQEIDSIDNRKDRNYRLGMGLTKKNILLPIKYCLLPRGKRDAEINNNY